MEILLNTNMLKNSRTAYVQQLFYFGILIFWYMLKIGKEVTHIVLLEYLLFYYLFNLCNKICK